jgi:hypothetical protein
MAAVERGVEARHLRQAGPPHDCSADGGDVVGLVQRRERDEGLSRASMLASTRTGWLNSVPP